MSQLNIFYRAFKDYRKAIQDERESKLLRKEIVGNEADDKVTFTQSICTIEEDWVKAIEDGLVFIGKSIDEDRQFIRSEGTIDPIEKVRHVSRETTEHLAKHSNFITHVTQNADGEDELMPDKLYTVERLNNYAVYENRFLYMVLRSLDDFVSVRYNKIVRETNAYHGVAHLQKSVTAGKRRIKYTFDLDESSDDDPFLRSRSTLGAMLERLERIQRSIYYYLHTPLILEVAKADKLKPPVTKTNVLRMDKNFKEVVALYEFIDAYSADGFTITKQEHNVDFKRGDVAAQFSEPVLLMSFLAYQHGMDLSEMLKQQYEEEEEERRAAEARELKEKLANARARLKAQEISPEEYILMLEQRISDMEKGQLELIAAREKIEELDKQILDLQEQIEARINEIAELKEQHAEELRLRDEQYNDLKYLFDEQTAAHAEELAEMRRANEEQLLQLDERYKAESKRIADNYKAKEHEINERLKEVSGQNADLNKQLEEKNKQYAITLARLTALRKENGLITETEDYTSEAAFTELEHELEVFNEFVRGEWKSTRQLLRKEIITWKTIKAKKAKKDKKDSKDKKEKQNKQDKQGKDGQIVPDELDVRETAAEAPVVTESFSRESEADNFIASEAAAADVTEISDMPDVGINENGEINEVYESSSPEKTDNAGDKSVENVESERDITGTEEKDE